MKITEKGIELIKHFEGFKPKPYICSGGYFTIGIGHVIKSNEKFDEITEEQAEGLLKNDTIISERAVCRLINVPLTDGQFDALVSFTFNLGSGTLQRSSLRSKINRGEYADAKEEFPKWCYARGVKLRGLLRRRLAEAILFETGELIL